MTIEPHRRAVLDLRAYRPAAIVAIDLVQHSTKGKVSAQRARRILEDVFATQVKELDIAEAHFNYTGDGYLCALLGDSSSRLLDFLNGVIPKLTRELSLLAQHFRAGADFGFIHLTPNSLTRDFEHFDAPGIVASRLEHAAQSNEVLVSDTVRQVFEPLYPESFSDHARTVRTKDRDIVCYTLTIVDFAEVKRVFREAVFPGRSLKLTPAERGRILIVDDDLQIAAGLGALLAEDFEQVITASDGREAMIKFAANRFSLALLDVQLPDTSGIDLLYMFLEREPDLPIIMMSGVGSLDRVQESLLLGASYFLQKPFDFDEVSTVIDRCLTRKTPSAVRASLDLLCDDVAGALRKIQKVSERFDALTNRSDSDPAISLLRHKARGIVDDFLSRLRPGCDINSLLDSTFVQLGWLNRMDATIHRARIKDLGGYLTALVQDYSILHPTVRVEIRGDLPVEKQGSIPHTSLYVLAVCELIDNAIAAAGVGGSVGIEISVLDAAGVLHTNVSDSGGGIPAEIRNSLFAGGISTKGLGRGMGLSLVHDAITRLGGTVEYLFDRASMFILTIPLRNNERNR